MKVLDQQVYDYWKEKNSDDAYGSRIFSFAEDLANKFEILFNEKPDNNISLLIKENAPNYIRECDTDGITGFMYGEAISVLSQCWVYGKEIREWHNLDTQIGNEGEKVNKEGKVLNPAIINIG